MTTRDLLVPAGATAHAWCRNPMGRDGQLIRYLSWSSHDAAGDSVPGLVAVKSKFARRTRNRPAYECQ